MCVCVCACVRACVRVCVSVSVCEHNNSMLYVPACACLMMS